ncbi:phage repressor protein CI [Proteus mirabilis]|uniref:phage repressor protein CI n=1 Tax=Morganellaceae TaxID=1903414 RepID=UPI000C9AD023|nr:MULTISPECIES: phage repressor protein CI [Morganellaceae]EHF3472307.1 phage repressor protein [Proteus mirabilis]ELZ9637294.1 phage repressor protein CI [Proteus mirabilis]MCT0064762.1 helix-turn-helix domain-containing protein [Proteus mirabilis]MDK7222104.1 phage repressor protein CI [Proteus mirabilis]MDK7938483.1 phage repressor protein CI [Proteus mirabilis]
MGKFNLEMFGDSAPVLDRIIEAYGFSSKIMLAQHFEMASSSLAGRYKRDNFPADLVVRCMAETGANLEWLATGQGKKFDNQELDILRLQKYKIIDGKEFNADRVMYDKVLFKQGVPLPIDPIVVQDGENHFIVDRKFNEVYDGKWLVKIDDKISIRELTRMPLQRVRISGVGMAFDCELKDISIIGRVVTIIENQ